MAIISLALDPCTRPVSLSAANKRTMLQTLQMQ